MFVLKWNIENRLCINDASEIKVRRDKILHNHFTDHSELIKLGYENVTGLETKVRNVVSIYITVTKSAFLSNQSFVNVVCRLLNAAKVETNTSFNHRVY